MLRGGAIFDSRAGRQGCHLGSVTMEQCVHSDCMHNLLSVCLAASNCLESVAVCTRTRV